MFPLNDLIIINNNLTTANHDMVLKIKKKKKDRLNTIVPLIMFYV